MQHVLFEGISLYTFAWLFIIYSFIGWCAEVAAHAVTKGKFINRGFLNGPYCPIYGFGMVIVIICLTPIENNWLLLFLGSIALTTVLELVTAFIMEKFFHTRWWDYSNQKFNLDGYICLKYSLVWGIACVVVMKFINPGIMYLVDLIPVIAGEVIMGIFVLGMLADLTTMIISISNINKRIRSAAHIREAIHATSDKIGSKIADEVLDIQSKVDKLPEKKSAVQRRLEKAYPSLAKLEEGISKEELKQQLHQKIKEQESRLGKRYEKKAHDKLDRMKKSSEKNK